MPCFNKGFTGHETLNLMELDLQSVQLKATYDQVSGKWYLNGIKTFITNGDADISLVLAALKRYYRCPRISLFIYDRTAKL